MAQMRRELSVDKPVFGANKNNKGLVQQPSMAWGKLQVRTVFSSNGRGGRRCYATEGGGPTPPRRAGGRGQARPCSATVYVHQGAVGASTASCHVLRLPPPFLALLL